MESSTSQWLRRGLLGLLAAVLLVFFAPTVHAEGSFEETLDRLARLQALANRYAAERNTEADPIVLTLAYTRTGEYNTDIWMMTAGVRDNGFEAYVAEQDEDCLNLQGVGSVVLPNGQRIDFSHLLAAMNLVYNGIPITGSWGGDCMQLALAFQGQAADTDGYYSLMSSSFNLADDGTYSTFSDEDLRADLDSVILGARLERSTDLAGLMREYYAGVTDYDRACQFIALSFGNVDTANTDALRETVYSTLINDTGMQLFLYMNNVWSTDGWQIDTAFAPALRGAAQQFADYLASTANHEKIKSSGGTLMRTMASEALAAALNALGDSEAANAALAAHASDSGASAGAGSDPLATATNTLKARFDLTLFKSILLVIAALAAAGVVGCVVMLLRGR
ncbi:MAG: hypothetical protein ACI4OI_05985 [Gemmiger sp.]